MPKRNAKSDHMRRKSPTWIARVMEERMENVSGCCRSLAPSKAEWERHVVSHMPFRDWCRHGVAGWGLERRHQRHPGHDDQNPLVCIDYGYMSGDATPMLVAKDRRTGMVFALPVERSSRPASG